MEELQYYDYKYLNVSYVVHRNENFTLLIYKRQLTHLKID